MPRPPKEWLITDMHLFHDRITTEEFCGRPEGFEGLIIRNLQYLVAEQDILFDLGDSIFYKLDRLKDLLDSVKCQKKYLIRGNHDRKSNNWYLRNGYDGVFESVQVRDVLLSHKPQRNFPDGVRVNIHGHFHNTDHRTKSPEFNEWYDPHKHYLLALEYTNYKPVELRSFASKPPRFFEAPTQSG